jgi:hypothetical protein
MLVCKHVGNGNAVSKREVFAAPVPPAYLLMACASSMAKSASLPAVYSCAKVLVLNLQQRADGAEGAATAVRQEGTRVDGEGIRRQLAHAMLLGSLRLRRAVRPE